METVVLNGVSYTRVATLAKKFRYTTDYIGQLARAGKVEAELVGRSWYVSEASLLAHKDTRYKELRVNDKTSKIKTERVSVPAESPLPVSPRLSKKVLKRVHGADLQVRVPLNAVRYLPDEADLLPQPVAKKKVVPVELADETKVTVTLATPAVERLEFSPMPEVVLQGEVPVVELYNEIDDIDNEPLVAEELVEEEQVSSKPYSAVTVPRLPVANEARQPKVALSAQGVHAPRFAPHSLSTTAEPHRSHLFMIYLGALISGIMLAAFLVGARDHFFIADSMTVRQVSLSFEVLQKLSF